MHVYKPRKQRFVIGQMVYTPYAFHGANACDYAYFVLESCSPGSICELGLYFLDPSSGYFVEVVWVFLWELGVSIRHGEDSGNGVTLKCYGCNRTVIGSLC